MGIVLCFVVWGPRMQLINCCEIFGGPEKDL